MPPPAPRATYTLPPEAEELGDWARPTTPSQQLLDPTDLSKALALLMSSQALRRDDLAELMARQYAPGALQVLWKIASDERETPEGLPVIPVDVRRKAANDLLDRGYGKPITVLRAANGGTGSPTLDGEIEKAVAAAEDLARFQEYMDLPPDQWPEGLRKQAMEALELDGGKA